MCIHYNAVFSFHSSTYKDQKHIVSQNVRWTMTAGGKKQSYKTALLQPIDFIISHEVLYHISQSFGFQMP